MSNLTKITTYLIMKQVSLALVTFFWTAVLPAPANSAQIRAQNGAYVISARDSAVPRSGPSDDKNTVIPPGTILPVRLNSTISSAKCKTGQVITGRIMQDVPLSSGGAIKEGSKVVGHIVEVTQSSAGTSTRISLQFDKLSSAGQTIPVLTNLRAITGFMGVRHAQTPSVGMAEGDNFYALTTVQVGGDVVYGVGGPVTTAEDSNDVVGKALTHGVLGQVRANESVKCRGPIDGNDHPQALWVFSSDACGVYDLEHISIAHSGRSDPAGVIVLASDTANFKLQAGAGMLLRVN